MPLALWHDLDLQTCFYPCCAVKDLCTCPALVLRLLTSTSERCASRLVMLCRTATHGAICAYSAAFPSRGTRAERDLRALRYMPALVTTRCRCFDSQRVQQCGGSNESVISETSVETASQQKSSCSHMRCFLSRDDECAPLHFK